MLEGSGVSDIVSEPGFPEAVSIPNVAKLLPNGK
jgi:hypothetical protein